MQHLGRFPLLAPMREPYVDALLSLGIDPTAKDATVWKRESVHAVITDDGKFKIAVKWRGVMA